MLLAICLTDVQIEPASIEQTLMKILKKKSPNIAFRHSGWAFAGPFFAAVIRLKVDESELARLAIEKGLEEASRELDAKQQAEREAVAKIEKGLQSRPLQSAPFGLTTAAA